MTVLSYTVNVYPLGPLGFCARVTEVLTSGQDGEEVHCTRIYGTAADARYMARLWIDDNRER